MNNSTKYFFCILNRKLLYLLIFFFNEEIRQKFFPQILQSRKNFCEVDRSFYIKNIRSSSNRFFNIKYEFLERVHYLAVKSFYLQLQEVGVPNKDKYCFDDIKIIFDDAGFEFLGASLKKTTQPMATPSWIRTINNHI